MASTHCATRLRIVLKDYDKINKEGIDNIDLVKGEFVAGNQLQIIFGAGLVNEIYEVFSAYTGTAGSSMADVKQGAAKKMNPLQAVIKSLSDVFVDIMPGILAAALLSGLTGVLSQWDVVAGNATLFGINRLVSLASNGIFSILPLAVCYSACKRYGGKPILGLVMGAIEAQLLSDTGRNFLNPLMSVALMGQGGAVLGYLALNWKNNKVKELCIPSFISTLFGISEPAIFGVNLRYKFPLVAGCIGGAIAGGYVFLTNLASLGFGTTALPGLAICDPAGSGYINYIVAHLIALGVGLVLTVIFGKVTAKKGAAQ